MTDFETRMKNLQKEVDSFAKTVDEIYPIAGKKEFPWTPQQKMANQTIGIFMSIKDTLSELNARLVVLESK